MATLPKQISEKFLDELSQSDDVTELQINALRDLMQKSSKLKAVDVESVFAPPEATEL